MSDQPATPTGSASSGEGPAVLVVEDFAPLRVLLERVLGAQGHRITSVETAQAAQDACAAAEFDLIVTDVAIPGGNGADLVRQVAAGRPGLRVLFVSGRVQSHPDLEVPGARTEVLPTPFAIDELVDRVQRLLEAGGPATSA